MGQTFVVTLPCIKPSMKTPL